MPHYFTREEAEALLPEISVILYRIQDQHKRMLLSEEQLNRLRAKARGNGHGLQDTLQEAQREFTMRIQALQESLGELKDFGCELKDPNQGLIDFLSLRDGEEVYLCWVLGEERINYWHPLNAGFVGRRPL